MRRSGNCGRKREYRHCPNCGGRRYRGFGASLRTDSTGSQYADFTTSSAGLKKALAAGCATPEIAFADDASMGIVTGNGIRAPSPVSGSGAASFVAIFSTFGMPVIKVSAHSGDAATYKLMHSVMMKGLASTVIEAMQAAETAGCADWP